MLMRHHVLPASSLACALAGLLLAGAAHAAPRDTKTELQVNAAGTMLEITNTPSECGNGQAGCKEAKEKEELKLKMRLEGDKECKRPGGGYRWRLLEVYLGGYNSPVKPAAPGGLPAQVGNDFDVDLVTGLVTPRSAGYSKIDFRNSNQDAYSVWYRVDAICVDRFGRRVGEPISTDPQIINRGRGTL